MTSEDQIRMNMPKSSLQKGLRFLDFGGTLGGVRLILNAQILYKKAGYPRNQGVVPMRTNARQAFVLDVRESLHANATRV